MRLNGVVAAYVVILLCASSVLPWRAAHAQFFSSAAPYVPTASQVIDAMFEMALINPSDYVMDLGSGDGRVVIEAARRHGARGMGVEIDVNLVFTSNEQAKKLGVADKVSFVREDLNKTDLRRATVLTLYLSRGVNLKLRPRILGELAPGTRVLSHDFDMGDWNPDLRREVPVPYKPYGPPVSLVYLWYVPANAAGRWRWQLTVDGQQREYVAKIGQRFQELDAEVLVDGGGAAVKNVKLRGDMLGFTLVREMYGQAVTHEFSGRIEGDRAVGRVTLSGGGENATVDWVATRVERGRMLTE